MATILAVDDEPGLLQLVEMILSQAGHKVLCASTAVEALTVFSSYHSKFDLVLADVLMPGMNGIELARRLRALDQNAKILLMSGFVPEGLELPEDLRLLKKPFALSDLLAAVREETADIRPR